MRTVRNGWQLVPFVLSALCLSVAAAAQEAPPLEDRGYALGDVVMGDRDAAVTVVEYASLTCSHCAYFHATTFPQLKSELVDTGKANYIVRDVYFDGLGLLAGRLARCLGPDAYYTLYDVILRTQSDWVRAGDPASELYRVVLRAGAPPERLLACVQDTEYALALVDTFKAHMEVDEIEATPTFVIGGKKLQGAVAFEELAAAVEAALGE